MADRRAVLLGAALVTLIMVVSAMGLLLVVAGPAGAGATGVSVSTSPGPSAAVTAGNAAPSTAGGPGSALHTPATTASLSPLAEKALSAAQAAGVPTRDVFVPRAGATPAQEAQAKAQGHVTPLYTQYSPAPIGLADYGLSANPNGNGSIVASILNTSTLLATFDPNSTGVLAAYPFSSSPDAYGVQLNAVSTAINLFGNDSYSMWTQNVVEFYPTLGVLYLVTNVWNFSGPSLSANAIYAHGPYGNYVPGVFYYAEAELGGLSYPFNISLVMTNSVNASRNMVTFEVDIADPGNPSVNGAYPYDYVVFNSTGASPSNYTANGYTYNAFGLTNDFEVILGGPGGGANSDLFAADANLTLQYWNSTLGAFESVPSAYSYGGETGETVTGANVAWENNTDGSPTGIVTTGPSILEGLWNATGAAGADQLTLSITPTNAIYLIGPDWASNFTYEWDPYWAPQELTNGVFYLAPGQYNLSILLSDYTPVFTTFTIGPGGTNITMSLTANAAEGIYAPMYFWNNDQFAALSTGGSGTPSDPYQLVNTQTLAFPAYFGLFNDYTFPVFTGVFFWGTTASVVMNDMPSLTTQSPYLNFPGTNDLGYTFYFASNIALVNTTQTTGWFTSNVDSGFGYGFAGNYYGTYGILEWNSTGILIADDTFLTQTGGVSMANGADNTVFGNTFVMVAIPTFAACVPYNVCPLNLSEGLQVVEGNSDLIYNNAFYTTVTASSPPFNLYSGAVEPWVDTWNITPTPASTVNHVAGWPNFPLTGTIVGNATQGGNFWVNYGGTGNPIGTYPYTDSGQIAYGGDYYPLIPPSAQTYAVTFTETGLASGTMWTVSLDGVPKVSSTTTIVFNEKDGSYTFGVSSVTGYLTPSPATGTVTVSGAAVGQTITFTPIAPPPSTYSATFTEAGLTASTNWSVRLNGVLQYSTGTSIVFTGLANNSTGYPYTVRAVTGYTQNVTTGNLVIAGQNVTTWVGFTAIPPVTYSVTFTETGLTSGTTWSVTLGTSTKSATAPGSIEFTGLANATYPYSINAVSGYTSSPTTDNVVVDGTSPSVAVTFTANAPSNSSNSGLSTLDYGIIGGVIALIIILLVVALVMRGRSGGKGGSTTGNDSGTSTEMDDGSSGGGSA